LVFEVLAAALTAKRTGISGVTTSCGTASPHTHRSTDGRVGSESVPLSSGSVAHRMPAATPLPPFGAALQFLGPRILASDQRRDPALVGVSAWFGGTRIVSLPAHRTRWIADRCVPSTRQAASRGVRAGTTVQAGLSRSPVHPTTRARGGDRHASPCSGGTCHSILGA
jgi:hypothetical protein